MKMFNRNFNLFHSFVAIFLLFSLQNKNSLPSHFEAAEKPFPGFDMARKGSRFAFVLVLQSLHQPPIDV
jgi:hypothetical protein